MSHANEFPSTPIVMTWPENFRIGDLVIGRGQPPLLIPEAGVNHNGSVARAVEMVARIADAGIPAIKFQTFQTDLLVSPVAAKGEYQKQTTGSEGSQHEMLRQLELRSADFERIARECSQRGILFLSTPFDELSADFLAGLDMSLFKLSSADLTNLPLLEHIAAKGRPMILSTGMASLEEIDTATRSCRDAGCPALILLQCVSSYPAAARECNLRAMDGMAVRFGVPMGFSDHTIGNHVALAAVARGACVIEKHFTLDRGLPGPDHRASAEVGGIKALWEQMQEVFLSLGDGEKRPQPGEVGNREIARRSLHWKVSMPAGSRIAREHLVALRPEGGVPPDRADGLVGRQLSVGVVAGALVQEADLAG